MLCGPMTAKASPCSAPAKPSAHQSNSDNNEFVSDHEDPVTVTLTEDERYRSALKGSERRVVRTRAVADDLPSKESAYFPKGVRSV